METAAPDTQTTTTNNAPLVISRGLIIIPANAVHECVNPKCLYSWTYPREHSASIITGFRCAKCKGRKVFINGQDTRKLRHQAVMDARKTRKITDTDELFIKLDKENERMAKMKKDQAAKAEERAQDDKTDQEALDEKMKEADQVANDLATGKATTESLFDMSSIPPPPSQAVPILPPDEVKAATQEPNRIGQELARTAKAATPETEAPKPPPKVATPGTDGPFIGTIKQPEAKQPANLDLDDQILSLMAGNITSLEVRLLNAIAKYSQMPEQCNRDLLQEWKVIMAWAKQYLEEHKYIVLLILMARHFEWVVYAMEIRAKGEKTATAPEPAEKAPEAAPLENAPTTTETALFEPNPKTTTTRKGGRTHTRKDG